MTIMKIIDGLYFTIGMILFNPLTGESKTPDQLNEDDRTTYDACMGAIALLKAQEQAVAYWIPCNGKSHIWYCSECGEKINYNNARRTYKTEKKPVEAVNRYCRGCGATMVQRPTDEQREKVACDKLTNAPMKASPWEVGKP